MRRALLAVRYVAINCACHSKTRQCAPMGWIKPTKKSVGSFRWKICRRAERAIVTLGHAETLNDYPRQYMNRLSDLMFVLARVLNRHAGGGDVLWEKGRERG